MRLRVAQVFGLGRLPRMPGTWASAATVLALGLLPGLLPLSAWCLAAGATAAGLAACQEAVRRLGESDPPSVVVDEVAGQALAMVSAPTWPWFLAAFLGFRLLDVLKPWPVGWAERLPGAWGIMADDLLAGAMAAAALWALRVWA